MLKPRFRRNSRRGETMLRAWSPRGLRRSGYPELSAVECQVCMGVALLTGVVPTFHLKQLAQSLAAHTPGVCQVVNHLLVTKFPLRPRLSAGAIC